MQHIKKVLLISMTLGVTALCSNAIADESVWDKNHPRRDQVNERLEHQNQRIHREVREGELTPQQAHQLRREDQRTRQEERDLARQNRGHITPEEQKALNQQENHISNQIGQ